VDPIKKLINFQNMAVTADMASSICDSYRRDMMRMYAPGECGWVALGVVDVSVETGAPNGSMNTPPCCSKVAVGIKAGT
jgi:hypothetical protein